VITLALDLATDRLSVAAREPGGRLAERHMVGARNHARVLIPLLEEVLAEVGGAVSSVTRVVLADGPGSFTGLRVAASLVKALAWPGATSVAVTPSLLGRASRVVGPGGGMVFVASSALRGEIYGGRYRLATDGVTVLEAARPLTWEAARDGDRPDLIAGDGPDGMLEALGRHWQVPVADREASHADARSLFRVDGMAGGTVAITNLAIWEPVYGRPAEAQARWELEHGRSLPDSSSRPG
jgi:tRNA threonylcarbamoyladenosine biosynthesis protein TsaB